MRIPGARPRTGPGRGPDRGRRGGTRRGGGVLAAGGEPEDELSSKRQRALELIEEDFGLSAQVLQEFFLLRAAEILHLGKNPTFGCGRLRVDLVD